MNDIIILSDCQVEAKDMVQQNKLGITMNWHGEKRTQINNNIIQLTVKYVNIDKNKHRQLKLLINS